MKNTYTTEKIEKFPIEKYIDRAREIKIIIDRNNNGEFTYEIHCNNSNIKNNLERNIKDSVRNEEDVLTGILDFNQKETENYKLSLGKLGDVVLDTKNNEISLPRIPTRTKMYMSQKDGIDLPKQQYFEDKSTKIKTDLHSHYTAMLEPEKLLALGLKHNINYNIFYIYALDLELSKNQQTKINQAIKDKFENKELANKLLKLLDENRGNYKVIEEIFNGNKDKGLPNMVIPLSNVVIGKYPESKNGNVEKILKSLTLQKETQNTFTDMTDTYNNRFPFTNGKERGFDIAKYQKAMESQNIPQEVKDILEIMCIDRENPDYVDNDLQDDQLLWIAREAQEDGIEYIEMSHNALSKKRIFKMD